MRRIYARRALLVALAFALPAAAGGGAGAADPDPAWIEQLQPGPVIEDFNVRTVLYDGNRFTLANGQTQRPLQKYLGFGTIEPFMGPEGEILARVAVATSDDGITWTEPEGITIKDPMGVDVPLIINDATDHFAVVYGDLPQMFGEGPETAGLQFALYYRDHAASSGGADDISEFHVALSADAKSFALDQPLSESGEPVISGGFKAFSFGPTQVLFNAGGATDCHTAPSASFPWDCRAVMVYAAGGGGLENVALAGSGDGTTWRGPTAPILTPSPAPAWDDKSVGLATIERVGPTYRLYYAGHDAASAGTCFGGLSGCFSVGLATSLDGMNFTKSPSNPAIPVSLLEEFSDPDPATLFYPSAVRNQEHFFFNRITSPVPVPGVPPAEWMPKRDFFVAKRVEVPGAGPKITIFNPQPGPQTSGERDVDLCLSDSLGVNVGVDPNTLVIDIDGNVLTGYALTKSLRCAIKTAAYLVNIPNALSQLTLGAHVLTVTVADFDGNVSIASVPFTIDDVAPDTTLTLPGTSPRIVLPLGSIGTIEGETVDIDSAISSIRAVVTNPLRMSKSYEARIVGGQISNPSNGFTFLSLSEDGSELTWRWIAPTLDLHTALPGPYTVSFLGLDVHNNLEQPDAQNTTELFII